MITQDLPGSINTGDDAPIYFLGLPTRVRAARETTNGAFALIDNVLPPGFSSPYHTHQLEDESLYVVEGEMAFVRGGEWFRATAGTYVFGPRGVAHGFKVVGDAPARYCCSAHPAVSNSS